MNKLLILLLAVCLISVQAFVKRDTAETAKPSENNILGDLQKQFEAFAKDANEKLKETFDPEKIKKGLTDLTDSLNKTFENFKKQQEGGKQ